MPHIFTLSVLLACAVALGACATSQAGQPVPPQAAGEQPQSVPVAVAPVAVEPSPTQPKPVPPKPVQPPKPRGDVMGWIEHIRVAEMDGTLKAKLDSGATMSSIHAEVLKVYKKDDKKFVLFRVQTGENSYETFNAPLVRYVKIKKKEGGYLRRPVVEMAFCIGNRKILEEVNLADRGHFVYPVLIGRNMLANRIVIDSSKTFTQKPNCPN